MKILLVDDHTLFREGLAMLLKPLVTPLEVWDAGNCEEAFELLERRGAPDMVLIDLAMPGMSGIEGLSVLHARHPETLLVALSSSDDKATVLQALDAGALGFIPKTSQASVMVGALRLILAKGIYLPPSVFLGAHPQAAARSLQRPALPGLGEVPVCRPSDLGLSPRQTDVLYQILQGKPVKLIGRALGMAEGTVKSHTSAVLRALNVTTRTQAVVAAGSLGLVFDEARTAVRTGRDGS